jgi:glycosyltransferase involved in cell wall biosynthesis
MPFDNPKVSVIIPTYNRAQFIARALKSVFDQTFQDFEIIVVDDGSTDQTRGVLAFFEDRIRYVYQENSGVSIARNRGIQEARAEYIAFLDSDDYWSPDKLAEQVKVLDLFKNVGIVYGRMPIVNENGKQIGLKPAGISGKNFAELMEVWGDLPTSSVMTRKECFAKAGMFDPMLGTMEDIDLWLRISRFYDLFEIKGKPLAFYYRHSGQITRNPVDIYSNLIKINLKILRNFPKDAPRKIVKRRIIYYRYVLSRTYYGQRSFFKAWKSLSRALLVCPSVGTLLSKENDTFLTKSFIFIKPYAYWIMCSAKALFWDLFFPRRRNNRGVPPKILFVHEHHDNIAGQELSLLERLMGLRNIGISVAVILPGAGIFADLLKRNEFAVITLPLNRLNKKWPGPYLKTVFAINRIIREGHFSVVHCSGVYPAQYSYPAARLSGRPCVVHVNSTIYDTAALRSNLVPYTDFVFTVSDSVRQAVHSAIKIPADKVMTVYDGILDASIADLATSRLELRKQFNIAPEQQIVGQISSVIPRKGIECFIKMAGIIKDRFKNVKFLIVGRVYDERYKTQLVKLITELKLDDDIIFTGFQENFYRFIDLFDVNVLSSNAEGLSRVIVHAQTLGKVMVATDVGGSAEAIINNVTGMIVPPGNPAALAEVVLDLLNNPWKAKLIGEKAKTTASTKFNIDRHAQNLLDVYQRILI